MLFRSRGFPAIQRAAEAFDREESALRKALNAGIARQGKADYGERELPIRAWCLDFAVRAAQASITASSGAANLLSHPAQRRLREAIFYTIQAQTQEVMDATLARLERGEEALG